MSKNLQFKKRFLKAEWKRLTLRDWKGFTLVEMVVAVGIFCIVMLLASALVISIIRANYKTRIQRQVNDEARNIIETITREAKLAFGKEGEKTITVEPGGKKLVLVESPSLTKSYQLTDAGGGNQSIEVKSTPFATSSGERPKRDIVLVVDASESMNDMVKQGGVTKERHEWVKEAIEKFLKSSSLDPTYDQVALVSYNGTSTIFVLPNYHQAEGRSKIRSNLTINYNDILTSYDGIVFVSSTGIPKGMEEASGILLGSGRPDAQKFQILLSDGCANTPHVWYDKDGNWQVKCNEVCCVNKCCGGTDIFYHKNSDLPLALRLFFGDLVQDKMDQQIKRAVNNGISVFTVGFADKDAASYTLDQTCCRGFGNCLDSIYLNDIAQQTGGGYFKATKPEDFVNYFKVIAGKMYKAGPSNTALITSGDVNVKDLKFDLYDDKTQPFLNIEITVESKDYDTSPSWRRASVTYKTTISSRDYIEE